MYRSWSYVTFVRHGNQSQVLLNAALKHGRTFVGVAIFNSYFHLWLVENNLCSSWVLTYICMEFVIFHFFSIKCPLVHRAYHFWRVSVWKFFSVIIFVDFHTTEIIRFGLKLKTVSKTKFIKPKAPHLSMVFFSESRRGIARGITHGHHEKKAHMCFQLKFSLTRAYCACVLVTGDRVSCPTWVSKHVMIHIWVVSLSRLVTTRGNILRSPSSMC